ncbi:hypothetical protein [Crenothrix sp.]|uniref:hypothetical protein n=1 Tax=Crenothrix sp. TaxID=3100433 RepID=UPI00374C96D1
MKSIFSSQHANVEKTKIASVGMPDEQVEGFKKLLANCQKNLNSKWLYTSNYDANETINTMGSHIDAEYLLIDIDDELGKRVWYFLAAIRDVNKTIAVTSKPWNTDAQFVISKPLSDKAIEPTSVNAVFNKIDSNVIPVNKSPKKSAWQTWYQSKIG